MRKNIKISLIIVFILAAAGVFVFYQTLNQDESSQENRNLTDPAEIFEITIDKKEVLEKVQGFDDPKILITLSKKVRGNSEFLTKHLNEALAGMERLLSETKAAFDEGRATAKPDRYGGREIIIKTATGQIAITLIRDDGTFTEIGRYDNNFRKTERVSFHDDKKTVKSYMGPMGRLHFGKNGSLSDFGTVIEGKNHNIGWGSGKINSYRISDVPDKSADN